VPLAAALAKLVFWTVVVGYAAYWLVLGFRIAFAALDMLEGR
jgi:hypothetical protein